MEWKNTIKKNIFGKDPEEMTDFMNITPRMKELSEKRKGSKESTEDIAFGDAISSYRGMDEHVMPIAEKMYDLILKELDKVVGSIGEENKYSKEEGIEDLRATILAIMYGNNKRF